MLYNVGWLAPQEFYTVYTSGWLSEPLYVRYVDEDLNVVELGKHPNSAAPVDWDAIEHNPIIRTEETAGESEGAGGRGVHESLVRGSV